MCKRNEDDYAVNEKLESDWWGDEYYGKKMWKKQA